MKNKRTGPKPSRRRFAYLEAAVSSFVLDEGGSYEEAVTRFGLGSIQQVKTMVAREEGRRLGQLEQAPIAASAKSRLDARQRRMDKELAQRIYTAALKMFEQWHEMALKRWVERADRLEQQIERRDGIFTAAEFKTLMMVCHPDTGAAVSIDRRNEAMRLLTENKLRLLNEMQERVLPLDFPKTYEDLMRARDAVRAANSERSRRAHERRKGAA